MRVEGSMVIANENTAFFLTKQEESKLDGLLSRIHDLREDNYRNYRYKRDSAAHERSQQKVDSAVEKFESLLLGSLGVGDEYKEILQSTMDEIAFLSDVQCPFGVRHCFEVGARELIDLDQEEESEKDSALSPCKGVSSSGDPQESDAACPSPAGSKEQRIKI